MKKTNEIFLRKESISVNVYCYSFFDTKSNYFVAFCPALNISDYSKNEDDARTGLDVLINDAVDTATIKDNLIEWLLSLGWKVQTQPIMILEPPHESFLKTISSELNHWMGSSKTKQIAREIQFA